MSKGSNRRPTDDAAFSAGYERVFRQVPSAPASFGFVITDPESYGNAASRRPTTAEQDAIDAYRLRYKRMFGAAPEGVHVIPHSGLTVFLPTE